ncbi:MAG: hypothetical protein WCL14_04900 [Bacteroidota bacterium]
MFEEEDWVELVGWRLLVGCFDGAKQRAREWNGAAGGCEARSEANP